MEYAIPLKTLRLWQLRSAICGIILIVICIMLTKRGLPLLIGCTAVIIIFGLLMLWYLPRLFKNCRCRVVNNSVILEIGLFIRKIHIFPLMRLIYTQTLKTPLSSLLGLMGISLKAARNRIYIPELSLPDAERLLAALKGSDDNKA